MERKKQTDVISALRKEHRKLRQEMTEEICKACERKLTQALQKEFEKEQGRYYYVYYPLGKEAGLVPFIQWLFDQGKRVAFPRVDGDEMDFYEVCSFDELEEGSFHIMEPAKGEKVFWKDAVVLVPGLVFDRAGNRIGYGRGYYDRYLRQHPVKKKIGVAYQNQIEEEIQAQEWDVQMDLVITEQGAV